MFPRPILWKQFKCLYQPTKIHFKIQKEHESKEGEGRKEMEADQKRWNDIWKVWKWGDCGDWINCKKILKDAEIQQVWCKYLQADRKQGDGPVSWWNEHISPCSPQPVLLPNEHLTIKLKHQHWRECRRIFWWTPEISPDRLYVGSCWGENATKEKYPLPDKPLCWVIDMFLLSSFPIILGMWAAALRPELLKNNHLWTLAWPPPLPPEHVAVDSECWFFLVPQTGFFRTDFSEQVCCNLALKFHLKKYRRTIWVLVSCLLAKLIRKMILLNSRSLSLISGSAAVVFVTVAILLPPLCTALPGQTVTVITVICNLLVLWVLWGPLNYAWDDVILIWFGVFCLLLEKKYQYSYVI